MAKFVLPCIVMLSSLLSLTWSAENYCSFTKEHTMCKYKGIGPSCNGEVLRRLVTKEEIKEILDAHNRFRAKIANGDEKRGRPGPQPAAANMKQLEWDDELARIAQRHADQCQFEHDCSSCRTVKRFGVGQNLYIFKQSLRLGENNWTKGITDWYNEVELFSRKHVEPFQFTSAIGHYSQMVWADTYKVGCGATSYRDGKWFATLYTCNYGPNGNYIRGQMYEKGDSCSNCPSGFTCSKEYPGLCAQGKDGKKDNEVETPEFKPQIIPDNNERTNTTTGTTGNRFTPPSRTVVVATTKRPTTTTTRRTTTTTTRRTTTTSTTTTTTTTARTTTVTSTTKRTTRPTVARIDTTTTTAIPSELPRRQQQTGAEVANSQGGNDYSLGPFSTNKQNNGVMRYCSFETEIKDCKIRHLGVKWELSQNSFDGEPNTFYETDLSRGDATNFFFSNLAPVPEGGKACLDFRYKKYSKSGQPSAMIVQAWPFRGKPGKISIQRDSPDPYTWVRAQVTYRNINSPFQIVIKANGPESGVLDQIHLAVDDITLYAGRCQ